MRYTKLLRVNWFPVTGGGTHTNEKGVLPLFLTCQVSYAFSHQILFFKMSPLVN